MKHDELINLLRSDNPDKVKKALQHIKTLIGKEEKITDDILVLMLQSNVKVVYNTALKYLIEQKQKSIFSKLRVPIQLKKDAIFDHACYELWRYVRKRDFDTSEKGAIERFLYVLCKRYISKHTKNPNSNAPHIDLNELPELPDNSPLPIYKADAYKAIEELFDRLGKGCKEILVAKYFEGKKFKDIAKELNRDEGVIKVTSYRCMKKLRTWVAKNDNLAKYIKELLSN